VLAPPRRLPGFIIVRMAERYRRRVPVVRALAARNWSEPMIARHLGLTLARVRLARSEGAGIWSEAETKRMRAAMTAFRAECGR
jgi:hypothetical protein